MYNIECRVKGDNMKSKTASKQSSLVASILIAIALVPYGIQTIAKEGGYEMQTGE